MLLRSVPNQVAFVSHDDEDLFFRARSAGTVERGKEQETGAQILASGVDLEHWRCGIGRSVSLPWPDGTVGAVVGDLERIG